MSEELPSRPPLLLQEGSLDTLKVFAALFMLCDHASVILGEGNAEFFRYIGRGSYPLFCFAMACALARRPPSLDAYLLRLVAFALLSQPLYILVFDTTQINILFTLCLAALASRWLLSLQEKQQHLVFFISLFSFLITDPFDYDIIGLLLPAALVLWIEGKRRGWLWTAILLIFLNTDLVAFVSDEEGAFSWVFSWDIVWTILATYVFFLAGLGGAFFHRGKRYLPRYAMYLFYPIHLAILLLWRLAWGDWPTGMWSI
jgi:hypothetical protein